MDQYTKGEQLGKGTFGTVFKATHTQVSPCTSLRSEHAARTNCKPLILDESTPSGHNKSQRQPPALYVQTGQVVAIKKIRLGEVKEVACRIIHSCLHGHVSCGVSLLMPQMLWV